MASLYENTQKADVIALVGLKQPRRLRPLFLVMADFCLLTLAFFALNYWKQGTVELSPKYLELLMAFYGIWFLVSISTGKFRPGAYKQYRIGLRTIAKAGVYLAYFVGTLVILLGLYGFSRGHIFGTCIIFVLLECLLFSTFCIWYASPVNGYAKQGESDIQMMGTLSVSLLAVDFLLVGISFLIVNYAKRDGFHLPPDYEKLLLLLYGIWFIFSMLTHKFERRHYTRFHYALWPWIKSGVLLFLTLALIVFLFRFTYFSRTQVFGPVVLLLFFEGILCAFHFRVKKNSEADRVPDGADDPLPGMETALSVDEKQMLAACALVQEELPCFLDFDRIRQALMAPVREKLRDRVFKDKPVLFDFLDQTLGLSEIIQAEMVLRNSADIIPHDPLSDRSVRLLINLHKVNDLGQINRYFHEAHNMLLGGGYFVGMAHTIQTHRDWMLQKYPGILAHILYGMDFMLHRVLPKIPRLNRVYFVLTRGRGRLLSKAELLGRLCYCGFQIVAEKEIQKRLYFVVRKMLTPSLNEHPTYGPFVALKRMGTRGEVLTIHKFRTMHPYSEFLQDYVYEHNGLQKGGKLSHDFRVTAWGKVMRRLWLDELPMLYNWLKGDLQLFGVRPLSYHYLSLYPPEVQALRMQVKPGLVPPFYADMPKTFEEICDSEKHYIQAYLRRPLRTQVVYFRKAFCNIVFKGARSE